MAKKPMGINDVFGRAGTGMEALVAATGASSISPSPSPASDLHLVTPLADAPHLAPLATTTPATARATSERHIATNVRLRADQWEALRREALDRALARRGGKADASEVLREILDGWLENRRSRGGQG